MTQKLPKGLRGPLGWRKEEWNSLTRINIEWDEGSHDHPPEGDQNNKQKEEKKDRQADLESDSVAGPCM